MTLTIWRLRVTIGRPEPTLIHPVRATCICVDGDETSVWTGPWRPNQYHATLDRIAHEHGEDFIKGLR